MAFIQKRKAPINFSPKGVQYTRDLSSGQNTDLDPDKIKFDLFSDTMNMRMDNANLQLRYGVDTKGDIEGIQDVFMHSDESGDTLCAKVKDGANSKIVSVNETTLATTDQISMTGQEPGEMASLFTRLYSCNSGDANVYGNVLGGTQFTVAVPNGELPFLLTSNGERVWMATKEGILRGSDTASANASGQISTFVPTGTTTNRAVIASSQITKFTALASAGRIVCACGENRTELHSTPDFTNAGIDVFPANMNTMKDNGGFPNLGVTSRDALLAVGNSFWLKPEDDTLYRVGSDGSLKSYQDDSGQMEKLQFDQAALAYDQRTNLLYISCRSGAANDTVITFNVLTEKFSYFKQVRAEAWATRKDKVYFLKSLSETLVDAFDKDFPSDDGAKIKFNIRTAFTYGNSQDFWKRAEEAYINFIYKEQHFSGTMKLLIGKIGGEYEEIWSKQIQVTESSNPFMDVNEIFYNGAPGAPELDYEKELFSEYHNPDIQVRRDYYRAALQFTGSTDNKFVLRGIGIKSTISARKKRESIYN